MELSLKGEIALVTGASRGIGKAIALTLKNSGATVFGTATSDKGAQSIASFLGEDRGLIYQATDSESLNALLETLKNTMPTILVNNAAITRDNLFMRMKDEEWLEVIETNLNAVFRLTKACIRPMMKAKQGRIINIASVVGFGGNAGQANYVTTKAGLVGFTKTLALELGARNITVNAIAPGFIETDMTQSLPEDYRKGLLSKIPLARAGTPEEIANAVLFLASPAASYITGTTLHINGGMYL
ncbi:MAG: 3-ketoacyl-ACP reductase [Pseudomonadota bacterium]|jgi:3-oxoacyl-[acyl-carrier protein] reductase